MAKKKEEQAKAKSPVRYVHVSEFLATRSDLSEADKQGFRVWLSGRTYQHSMENFEEELKRFFDRER